MSLDRPLPIRQEILALREPMIRMRRDLHEHPELGFRESRTASKVIEALSSAFPEIHAGIAETGVSAVLDPGGGKRRAILFRADMDALPIQEESPAPYASRNAGVMHACGHDGHTSILAHTALAAEGMREALGGPVRFVFQPAEEGPGGALPMIEAGILEEPPVEAAFGLHLWSGLPTGVVALKPGPMMAAADEFELTVHGRGGHGAYPHETVDAVYVGSQIVVALQSLVSRNTDPFETAVVSVGTFQAGHNFNIIAETAHMRGTLRTFNAELRTKLIRRLREVAEGIATSLGARCEFVFKDHYPATVNDPRMAEFVASVAGEVVGPENVIRNFTSMGGEDMSYFLQRVPGAYFFLGAQDIERGIVHPHHSPHFDVDEAAFPIGAEIFLRIMERYWTRFPETPRRLA